MRYRGMGMNTIASLCCYFAACIRRMGRGKLAKRKRTLDREAVDALFSLMDESHRAEIDRREVEDLFLRMNGIMCLDDALLELGPPDDRLDDIPVEYRCLPARTLLNVHRYWRHWKSIAVDVGTWEDNGEFHFRFYKQSFLRDPGQI